MLEIQNLSKKYSNNSTYAIREFNLKLTKGEILCIMGPNGSGKTTTINSMLGIINLSSGKILINGLNIESLDIKEFISYIPDETLLIEELTGKEYIDFVGSIYNIDYLEKSKNLIEIFNMGNSINKLISNYSHGMKKKLQIITSFMLDREIIIMDEPFRGLDIESVLILERLIKYYSKKGKSIVIATHDPNLAEKISDKIIILLRGNIIENDYISKVKFENDNMNLSEILTKKVFNDRRIENIEEYIENI